MEYYFNSDIVTNILNYLDKPSSFNFINTAKFMETNRKHLYVKFRFAHDKIQNDDIRQYIEHLSKDTSDDIESYTNLRSLRIRLIANDEVFNIPTLRALEFKYNGIPHKLGYVQANSLRRPINVFSESICEMKLELSHFNEQLYNLPKYLRKLDIQCPDFNHPLDNLPNTLKELKITSEKFNQNLNTLPVNLESLIIVLQTRAYFPHDYSNTLNSFKKLPCSLKSFELICETFNENLDHLPQSLTSLVIKSDRFNKPLNNLPYSLQSLNIKAFDFNQPLDVLPIELKHLTIYCHNFNQSLDHLPPILETLNTIDCCLYTQPLDYLPESLQSLTLNFSIFNQSLDHLPKSLSSLKIICPKLNQELYNLPDKLNFLSLEFYNNNISFQKLPQSLQLLKIGKLCIYPTTTTKLNASPIGICFQ